MLLKFRSMNIRVSARHPRKKEPCAADAVEDLRIGAPRHTVHLPCESLHPSTQSIQEGDEEPPCATPFKYPALNGREADESSSDPPVKEVLFDPSCPAPVLQKARMAPRSGSVGTRHRLDEDILGTGARPTPKSNVRKRKISELRTWTAAAKKEWIPEWQIRTMTFDWIRISSKSLWERGDGRRWRRP